MPTSGPGSERRSGSRGFTLIELLVVIAIIALTSSLVAVALRMGLEPNDLKLITAAFVLIALVSPVLIVKLRRKPSPGAARA